MSPVDQPDLGQPGTEQPDTEPVVVVDARGLRCPLPVIELARVALDSPTGTVVEVWATDPAARADVPAWCRMRGHDYLGAAAASTGPPSDATTDGDGESLPTATAYRVRIVR